MDSSTQYMPGDQANGHVLDHDGTWQPMSLPPIEKPKKSVWARWYMIVAYVIVALVVIGQVTAGGSDETKADAVKPAAKEQAVAPGKEKAEKPVEEAPVKSAPKPKVMKVDAKTILKEFAGNEAAADIKYDGKTIAVTGIVDKVDTEIWNDDEYIVQIGDGSDFVLWTVNCDDQSKEVAAKITVGSKVTATGDFEDGGDFGIEMQGCTLS